MKHPMQKLARWQLRRRIRLIGESPAAQLPWAVISVAAAMLLVVLSAQAQDSVIPSIGGPGGGAFVARCPPGELLGGVELRVGNWVDAIRPLCRTPRLVVDTVEVPYHHDARGKQVYSINVSYGVNGDAVAVTDWYGGTGGETKFLVCSDDNSPIVSGLYIEAEGTRTVTVRRITMLCEGITGGSPTEFRNDDQWWSRPGWPGPVKTFEGPKTDTYLIAKGKSVCPVSRDNYAMLAAGIHGRSGEWLDALGLICEYPKLPKVPAPEVKSLGRVTGSKSLGRATGIKALGRVNVSPPTGATPRPICDVAREARARNSAAAPGLEAQCRAVGETAPQPPIDAAPLPAASPTITAGSNPVMVPNGQTSATTIITWKAPPASTYSENYLSVDNAPWSEFAKGGDGSKPATIKPGSTYTFRMMVYEGQLGTPKIITTLTVTARN